MPEIVPPGLGQASKIAPANPAAGAEIDYTFPTAARYHMLSVNFTFATDANIANRKIELLISLGTDKIIHVSSNGYGVLNGLTYEFSYYPAAQSHQCVDLEIVTYKLSSALYVSGKPHIETITNNIQVGDQYSNILIWVARWIEPA